MKSKVCGLKYPENINQIIQLQPDYVGFIFYKESKLDELCGGGVGSHILIVSIRISRICKKIIYLTVSHSFFQNK
jgi:hypothetical protein